MQERMLTQKNSLLASLPAEEQRLVASELEHLPLKVMLELQAPNEPTTHVWFPLSGVASMVADLVDGEPVEVATIGREGFVGLPVVLDAETMSHRTFIQVPGEALRVPAKTITALVDRVPRLHRLMLRYAMALVTVIGQSAACNRMHPIESRCARWLLSTRDRVDSDTFPLRQEFLAQMLGVTRPTVSVAAGILQKAGAIRYVRGSMTITDRDFLEQSTCECYGLIAAELRRLVGSTGES